MNSDVLILRKLAKEYFEKSKEEHNYECVKLHKAVNDLHMIRPVVLIDELPWEELNFNSELDLHCTNPVFKGIEQYLRQELFRYKYLRADMVLKPFIPIQKIIKSTGVGIEISENSIEGKSKHVKSHEYHDQLSKEEDIEKLHKAVITYDEEETNRRFNIIGEAIGDIIPIKKVGKQYFHISPWDVIAQYRGVTNLLIDLMERPEFSHKMVKKLFDIIMDTSEQYMKLGLYDNDPYNLHLTCGETDDLKKNTDDSFGYENIWGRGAAQVFSSVSKEMRDEFDITYMKDTVGRCGLVYYGCCEPLDTMIDIVEKIPHLRKITMTPWADVNNGAEVIGKKYVMANKPNPADVSFSSLDEDKIKQELTEIISAGRRNNCSFELTLKDISTCGNNPQNLIRWHNIAMDLVNNY